MSKLIKTLALSLLACFLLLGCKQDEVLPSRDSINIFLPIDPERLNPVYDSRSTAREVYQYLYVPVGDFHPETLELFPILIKSIPNVEKDSEEKSFFDIEIIDDAKWADGTKITGADYAFTVKSVSLPLTSPKGWKSILTYIQDIIVDENNPNKVRVYVDGNYMLAKELVSTVYLLPKHQYKNNTILDNLSLDEIRKTDDANAIEGLNEFVEDFNDPKHYTREVLGNGPYKLENWETDQSLSISKIENYWGEKYANNPFLQSNVSSMNFKIISDEMTAITALKDGALDVLKGLPAVNFENLKKEFPQASYLNSPSSRYYYISINNLNPLLEDANTRKALAKLVDVNGLIKNIEYGYGTVLTGPIHPDKEAYNENLSNEIYNVEEAKTLLKNAGWEDSNNNSIVDKVIKGNREELELDILITGGELGRKLALLLQEEANKAGVKINIVTKDIRRMRTENIYNYKYDLAALAEVQDIVPLDPYRRWHSDNINEKGDNLSGFSSPEADSIISLIRTEKNEDKREKLFEEFHALIYEEQPVIFLFSPTQKLIVSSDFEATVTAKRPGYLANTFKIKPAKK